MESIKAGWLGFPIAYIFAMCCDWFFVSKIAKGFAFKYLVKPDSSVKKSYFSILLYGCSYGDHYVTLWSSRSKCRDGKFFEFTDHLAYKYSKEFCNGTSISIDHCRTTYKIRISKCIP